MAGFLIPSETSLTESRRFNNMSEEQVVQEYLSHPPLPYNATIRIDKIGMLNFNCVAKEPMELVRYKFFRAARPDLFPACENPQYDYEDNEQVTPAIIISGNSKFRIDHKLWFPISDIVAGITIRQGILGRRLLPIEVFTDINNQWLVPLFNLGKILPGYKNK